MTEVEHPEIDAALFRQIAGRFASGVTAVTTEGPGGWQGMTATSFASLSLRPPMVLVCLDLRSSTLSAIERDGRFAINILEQGQEGISRALATAGKPELAGVRVRRGHLGVPVIEGSLAHFECRLAQRYAEGDHAILIGAVEAGEARGSGEPLLYFSGNYSRLQGSGPSLGSKAS